jgi:hypothetical protein
MANKRRSPSDGARRRSAAAGGAKKAARSQRPPPKRPTNLTLDPEAVARGERFGERQGTSLSQLVNRFLHALPERDPGLRAPDLGPAVRRLYGVAARGRAERKAYRAHLVKKYGNTA